MKLREFFAQHPDHRVTREWRGTELQLELNKSDRKTKVLWECVFCHQQWEAVPFHRTTPKNLSKEVHCPVCAGLKVVPGHNDLESRYPMIAEEWSPDNQLSPDQVTFSSAKKVGWVCSANPKHKWVTSVSERTRSTKRKKSTGCPHCSKQRKRIKVDDTNNFLRLCPDVAKLWDHEKNIDSPEMYSPVSESLVWWVDLDDPATIISRTGYSKKNNSPKKKVQPIRLTHPEISAFLSKEDSDNYSVGTKSLLEFTCPNNHSWSQRPSVFLRDGSTCPHCSGRRFTVGVNDVLSLYPDLENYLHPNSDIELSNVSVHDETKTLWVCDGGHESEKRISYVTRNYSPNKSFPCVACDTSVGEQELADFLSGHIGIIRNDRNIISPRELDIFVPDKNIAVEYNGLYWHNDTKIDRKYHYDKWLSCKDKGVQLITIWEDEWRDKRHIVENMLLRKLGLSSEEKVFARKTVVKEIDYGVASVFLEDNHIQGAIQGSKYLSLDYNDRIVAVMVFTIFSGKARLERYASNCIVPGGFTKLLSYFEKTTEDVSSVITFSDNSISDGGLYENNDFSIDELLAPDYKYVHNGFRHHKFGYRLKRFRNDPSLSYFDGKTEKELADLNGLLRVWDAGKIRWVKHI